PSASLQNFDIRKRDCRMKRGRRASAVPALSYFLPIRPVLTLSAFAAAPAIAMAACGDNVLSVIDRSPDNLGPVDAMSSGTVGGGRSSGSDGTTGGNLDAGSSVNLDAGSSGMFGPPRLIAAISDPDHDDLDPALSADELELYFASDRAGTLDI